MANYVITYSSGIITLTQGNANTATGLTFMGQNYANYGEPMNQNWLSLMENFASNTTGPNLAIPGMIWYDAANTQLKLNTANGTANWQYIPLTSSANGNVTFDNITANVLNANSVAGNGANITSINASAITSGTLSNNRLSGTYNIDTTGTANFANFAGNVTVASQPNITSVGTLTSLAVAGAVTANSANIANSLTVGGNMNVTGTITGNIVGNISGNVTVPGSNTQIIYNNAGVASASPNLTFNGNTLSVIGNVSATNLVGSGAGISSITGANITGAVPFATTANNVAGANVTGTVANAAYATNAGNAAFATQASIAGTVTTAIQPNITTVGNLTSLTVAGDINANNISANRVSGNGANLSSLTGANVTGTVANANYAAFAGVAYSVSGGNVTSEVANANYAAFAGIAYNVTAANVVGTVANANYAAFAGTAFSVSGANVTGTVANATHASTANTVTTASQPNITSVGTLTGLTVSGTANVNTLSVTSSANISGNLSVTGTITGNIQGNISGNFVVPGGNTQVLYNSDGIAAASANLTFTGNILSVVGTVNATTFVGSGSGLTNIPGANVTGAVPFATTANTVAGANVSGTVANATQATNANTAGTVTTAAQPNITSVGTLTGLNVSSQINATIFSSNVTTGTAPFAVQSTTRVANLNADLLDDYTTSVATVANTIPVRDSSGNIYANVLVVNSISASSLVNGNSNVGIPGANGNVTVSVAGNANVVVVTGTGANVAGTLNVTGNANVGNIGATNGVFTNISGNGANISALNASNITTGTLEQARLANSSLTFNGVTVSLGSTGIITANTNQSLSNGAYLTGGSFNGGTAVTWAVDATTTATANKIVARDANGSFSANVMTVNTINATSLVNGNSNISIPAANGNATISVAGTSNVVVVTGTGVNVSGTLNATGNANVGNLGTAQVLATANVTAPVLVSNVATGTAPLSITSTTRVNNLNVAYANVSDFSVVTAATTGVQFPVFVSGSGTGNYALSANSGISANVANGAIIATTFVGNMTGNITGILANGNSNLSIPAANGNVGISVSGNANVLTITGTGANITGTLNTSGNANVGNLGTAGLITATGNVTGGNITTAGVVSATGNVTGGNITTAGVVSATGNVTGGNLATAGTLSVTGTAQSSIAGNLSMNSKNIVSLADPVNAQDAATKSYVDSVAQGLHVHSPVVAATPNTLAVISGGTVTYNNGSSGVGATLTTTGSYTTIDGVNIATVGSRILVKNEANAAHNGIYTYTSSTVLTRATDFDTSTEMAGGDFFFCTNGTLYNDTGWVLTDPVTTVGTSNANFAQFSGAGTYTAGTGLTLTGTQFSISNTAVTATSYGNGDRVASFTVNSQGQLTAASNVVIAANAGNLTGTTLNSGVVTSSLTSVGTLSGLNVSAQVNATAFSSNVTTGTAPLTVASTTLVANLNADLLDGYNSSLTTVANTVVVRDANGSIAANVLSVNTITATSLVNGNSNIGIPVANGNATISVAGNANVLVVTGTGINVAGTLNATGNANAGNIGATNGVFTNVSGNGAALTALNASNITSGTLAQARLANSSLTVNGTSISLGGSATITANTVQTLSNGSYITGGSFNGGTAITWAVDATDAATASKVVARDVNGSFSANVITANSFSGPFTGNGANLTNINASNITTGTLAQARLANSSLTVNGTSISLGGSATITANTTQSHSNGAYITGGSFNGGAAITWAVDATDAATASKVVARDVNGSFAGNVITANSFVGNTNASSITSGTLAQARLANSSLTVNGTSISLGGSGTITSNTTNALTFSNAGSGDASGTTFNGGTARTISYNSVGAPSTTGTNASGTWSISITGSAGTAGTVTTAAQPNITSVGTLSSLGSSGNITAPNLIANTGYLIGSVQTGISANGSTQGTATALTRQYSIVSTVSAGQGVILPAATAGMRLTVINTAAANLLIYPATTAQINSLGANAAFTLGGNTNAIDLVAATSTQWYTINAVYA